MGFAVAGAFASLAVTACGTDGSTDAQVDDVVVLTSADAGGVADRGIPVNGNAVGIKLPDVQLDAPRGTIASSSLVGTPLVLNFWFSLCAPCKKELPDLQAVSQEYAGKVRFIGVNTADADLGKKFAGDLGVTYELLGDLDGRMVTALDINNFPVTVLVRSDGTIARQTGPITAAELRSAIDGTLLAPS